MKIYRSSAIFLKMRRRKQSPAQQGQSNTSGGDRATQLKSPVTSEGHEEWETASENSDFIERQKSVFYSFK